MRSIFLDTETTGLKPGKIVQLTYIIEENKKFIDAKNFFFMVEDGEMEESAARVHGFTVERLVSLSKGMIFEDAIDEIMEDLNGSIFIAHNAKFDLRFMNAEFERIQAILPIKKEFCTMEYFKNILKLPSRSNRYSGFKNPKMDEVVKYYNLSNEDILEKTKVIFNTDNISYHDARYDTMAMYLCCLVSQNRKIEL
ncbi:3'-5' exonuclease [Clostridium sp. DL1XJH146]